MKLKIYALFLYFGAKNVDFIFGEVRFWNNVEHFPDLIEHKEVIFLDYSETLVKKQFRAFDNLRCIVGEDIFVTAAAAAFRRVENVAILR